MGGAISQCSQAFCSYCLDAHKAGIETGDEIIVTKPPPAYMIPLPKLQTKPEFIQPNPPEKSKPKINGDEEEEDDDDFEVSSGSDTEERVEFEAPTASSSNLTLSNH